MEEQKIDSLFKKSINESGDFYANDAEKAKERVWNQVKTKKQVFPLFYRILAVASILLLIFLSVITYSNMKYKATVNELVESNKELKKDNQILRKTIKNSIVDSKPIIDTVWIESKNPQPEPIVITQSIKDTVYLKEIVYVEKNKGTDIIVQNKNTTNPNSVSKPKLDELISNHVDSKNNVVENEILASIPSTSGEQVETNFKKEIIIKNDKTSNKQKKRKRKFRIKFGGSKSKSQNDGIALSTRI
jgi:hypothetical protein